MSSALGLLLSSAVAAAPGSIQARILDAERLLRESLPPLDPDRPSFEVFRRLCEWVTARERLDDGLLRACYPVFMAEPWGTKHIATAFKAIGTALETSEGGVTLRQVLTDGTLEHNERWFVSHLLRTLYLGIYDHETRIMRIAWGTALMNEMIRDYRPFPGDPGDGREPGFWVVEPAAAQDGKVAE